MSNPEGLLYACQLDGRGGGREVGWEEIRRGAPEAGLLWIHLDYEGQGVADWLGQEGGIEPLICEALCSEDPRPRSLALHDGLLVILRGVNLNPGADPEDMVALRLWIEPGRVISLRRRRVLATEDLRAAIDRRAGPCDAGDFLVDIADHLIERVAGVLTELDEEMDAIEETLLESSDGELRPRLSNLRRQSIRLRRYLSPQRETMARLQTERAAWLDDLHRGRLREIADRTLRYVEDLDAQRDRASVTHEEIANRLAEQMNRRMYALSVVAGVFLPLSFVTGLLGINVGGIPGTDDPVAFAVVCGALVGLVGVEVWLFRRLGWM